jgi:Leucine-rich repeat (LRR) protein
MNSSLLRNTNFSLLPNLSELNLGLIDLSNTLSIFGYINSNLQRLWLQGSILNSDLSFLNRFSDLIELDLSSVEGIIWQNRTILSDLLKLEILKMSGISLNSDFLKNNMLIEVYKRLVYLDLSNNSIEHLNINLKILPNLKFIILSYNMLKILDMDRIPCFFLYQDLSFNKLEEVIYSTELMFGRSVVLLNNNNFGTIDDLVIFMLLESTKLDLSANNLNLINTKIEFVDELSAVMYTANIQYLNLSSNYLKQVGNIFTPLYWWNPFLPITILDLSNNQFESLNFSFTNLPYLKYLYLSRNRLTHLSNETFLPLHLLLELDISNNELTLIERNTLKSLETLEYLNMSSNLIKYIYQDQFHLLIHLIYLDISNNSIETIHPDTFSDLIKLENLFIHINSLKIINKLTGLRAITNIYLDSRLIVENPINVFNLKESIQIQLYKNTSRGIIYLKSVNMITYPHNLTNGDLDDYCRASIFLIKYNISLNLKTDHDFDDFFSYCEPFAAENMFTESSLDNR